MADKVEVVSNLAGLEKRRTELTAEGRVVLPNDKPEIGRIGLVACLQKPEGFQGRWTTADEDPVFVDFFIAGRPLQPDVHDFIDASQMEAALQTHSKHPGFRPYKDILKRQVGFLCHCEADSKGLCHVYTVSVSVYKGLREDLRLALLPAGPPVGT